MMLHSLRLVKKHACCQSLTTFLLLLILINTGTAGPITAFTRVSPIDIPVAINAGRSDNIGPFWTFSDLRSIALSPSANGESKIGWQDINGTIHVTPLTAKDQRKANDILIGPGKLYDLVALDNGFAALIMQDSRMYLDKYNDTGIRLFRTELTDADDRVDDWHTGKLAYTGTQYVAYFSIHGTSGFSEGHEGDKLKYISSNGSIESGGWEWGCSHSMDQRLIISDSAEMPICISDCYPGKGIYVKNSYKISGADGNCAGVTNARFGEAAIAGEHGVLVYLTIDNRTHWDVVLDSFSGSAPYTIRTETPLTNTPDQSEINPKVISFSPEKILVSWETSGQEMRTFQFFDLDGNPLGTPEMVDVHAGPVNDFKIFPNGDIGWAYAWGTMNELKIVRIQRGDINGDGTVNLKDVLSALKVATGETNEQTLRDADVSGDERIGLAEALILLQTLSEI